MVDQDIPTIGTRPDYNGLKKRSVFEANPTLPDREMKQAVEVNQALDAVLPEDADNPTIKALRELVRKFMMKTGDNGQIFFPDATRGMKGSQDAIENNPQLANAGVVKTITNTAMHCGEEGTSWGIDNFAHMGRAAAQAVLTTIVEKRPELADAALVANIMQMAANDPDSAARAAAQHTLAAIAERRSDLIDPNMIETVTRTASSPIADHDDQKGPSYSLPWVKSGKLTGNQWDVADNEARKTAQQTLRIIAEKRPDLIRQQAPAAQLKSSGRLAQVLP